MSLANIEIENLITPSYYVIGDSWKRRTISMLTAWHYGSQEPSTNKDPAVGFRTFLPSRASRA